MREFNSTALVTAGARMLDEHCPGWEKRINVETLDVGDRKRDPLGQIYGDYILGCEALGIANKLGDGASQARRTSCGFSTSQFAEVEALTNAWKRLVTSRLAA